MILEDSSIDVDEIMVQGSAIFDDYSLNHPIWEDAIKRVDRKNGWKQIELNRKD